jgi:hypothetical protein
VLATALWTRQKLKWATKSATAWRNASSVFEYPSVHRVNLLVNCRTDKLVRSQWQVVANGGATGEGHRSIAGKNDGRRTHGFGFDKGHGEASDLQDGERLT